MREITISVEKALETLKANRTKHEAEYAEAREIWEGKVKARLTEVGLEAASGHYRNARSPLDLLPKPEKFTPLYDEAIAQLEWSVDEQVTLDEHDFKQYVLDEWAWRSRFAAATSAYLVAPA